MRSTENVYFVFDRLTGRLLFGFTSVNDTLAVRDSLLTLRVPLKDSVLLCVGSYEVSFDGSAKEIDFQLDTDLHFFDSARVVPWNCYKFPETPAEALSLLELDSDSLDRLVNGGK